MKKSLSLIACLFALISIKAQSYDPTTLWPYIYKEFAGGVAYFDDNTKVDGVFNIHLLKCKLHMLEGKQVSEVTNGKIARVDIGEHKFIYIDDQLCEMLASNAKAVVVKLVIGDFDKLMSGTGAYGSTLNTSGRTELSSIEIGGQNITDHNDMRTRRDNSRILPLKTKYYIIFDGKTVECTKKAIARQLPDDQQDAWKAYLKENKVKFGKDGDAEKIVGFFK